MTTIRQSLICPPNARNLFSFSSYTCSFVAHFENSGQFRVLLSVVKVYVTIIPCMRFSVPYYFVLVSIEGFIFLL
jgi:hypothetical protein